MVAPFVALAMLGAADVSFYLRAKLRLDTAATSLAQVTTQYSQLYDSDFTTLFKVAQLAAGSVSVTGQFGGTIISGIKNVGGVQVIAWQRISPSSPFASQFGVLNAAPQLPAQYVLPIGATLVVTEVYSQIGPWDFAAYVLGGPNTPSSLGSVAMFQPRLAPLNTVLSGNRS